MMMCKKQQNGMGILLVCVGAISFLFGLIGHLSGHYTQGHMAKLFGMFTGFGFSLIAVAIVMYVRFKLLSKEKLEQEEIERTDERNIAISRAAGSVGFIAGILVLAALSFVLTFMGYPQASIPCIIGLYIVAVSTGIARLVYQRKM